MKMMDSKRNIMQMGIKISLIRALRSKLASSWEGGVDWWWDLLKDSSSCWPSKKLLTRVFLETHKRWMYESTPYVTPFLFQQYFLCEVLASKSIFLLFFLCCLLPNLLRHPEFYFPFFFKELEHPNCSIRASVFLELHE